MRSAAAPAPGTRPGSELPVRRTGRTDERAGILGTRPDECQGAVTEDRAMPTYEYRCKDCGHDIEVVQSFTDAPLTVCRICGGSLRKVFSPVGVVLKGSGFYRTDSRSLGGQDGRQAQGRRVAASERIRPRRAASDSIRARFDLVAESKSSDTRPRHRPPTPRPTDARSWPATPGRRRRLRRLGLLRLPRRRHRDRGRHAVRRPVGARRRRPARRRAGRVPAPPRHAARVRRPTG